MQIISYLNTQTVSSNLYGSLTVDEMLKKQGLREWKKPKTQNSSSLNSTNIKLVDYSGITINKSFPKLLDILERISHLMLKLKWVYLASFIVLVIWALVINISNVLFPYFNTISLSTVENENVNLLNTEMLKFISTETDMSDDFDSNGNLVLPELKTTNFEKPVIFENYVVKSGDNISTISKKFNLSNISTLISANSIKNVRKLYVGDDLLIPSIDGIMYTIKNGDSLSQIAASYGVTIESLLDVNNLSDSVISVGEKLYIPGATLDSNSLKSALGELFVLPLKVSYRISSAYGYRADPFTGERRFHTGIDLAAPLGTAIRSAMSGTVVAASYSSVFGNYVILRHVNGYQTLYAHMTSYSVSVGQEVSQGQRIGSLGSTGYSTGPHLHFTVYKNGKLINPTEILKF